MTDVSDDRKYLFCISMKGCMYFYMMIRRWQVVGAAIWISSSSSSLTLSVVVKPCLCLSAIEG